MARSLTSVLCVFLVHIQKDVCLFLLISYSWKKKQKTNNPVTLSGVYNKGFIFHLLESISSRLQTNCFPAQKNLYWCGQDLKFSNVLPLLGMFWISSVQWIILVVEPNSLMLNGKRTTKTFPNLKISLKKNKSTIVFSHYGLP